MALDFFAGCLGGCAGIIVGYPLDTVKVHMQTQDYRNPLYRGTWHCFRTLLAKESITGLYRGMSSPMAGVAAINAIVFGAYGQSQRYISDTDKLSAHFVAGATAGIAQTVICSPIELAKTRLQLQSSSSAQFSGPMQCLQYIYKHEGYRGVFRGVGITLLREAPSYGVYFATYEALTRTTDNEPISTARMLMAGGLAGTASWVISYPIDVVKSRVQAECSNRYAGAWDCLKQSIRSEGYSCLYRGLNSTIIRAFPTNAATFAVVTWTFRLLGQETGEQRKMENSQSIRRTLSGLSNECEPMFNNWNVLLQRISDDRTPHRSYYATTSTFMSATRFEVNYCSCNMNLSSTGDATQSQISCKTCEARWKDRMQRKRSEEAKPDQEKKPERSYITETFVERNVDSKSGSNVNM